MERSRRRFALLDALIAFLLIGRLTYMTLRDLHPATSEGGASDLKTLYASAWCLGHRISAYSLDNLRRVFVDAGVVTPQTWFGHAPVYPPTTLVLILPFTALPMQRALPVIILLCALSLALALIAVMRYGAQCFGVGMIWRLAIAAWFVKSPLVKFGLSFGNMSIPAASLAILGFTLRNCSSPWLGAVAMAGALLLKPHIALWVVLSMLLLPEVSSRKVAWRSLAIVAVFTVFTMIGLAVFGQLGMQMHGYGGILAAETAAGASMSASSRDVLELTAQLTSLKSLVGFPLRPGAATLAVCDLVLLLLACVTVFLTRRARNEESALLATLAWSAFGLVATYHRAHDAVLLLLLLAWVPSTLHRVKTAAWGLTALLFYLAATVGPGYAEVHAWTANGTASTLRSFLVLRQAALADLALTLIFLFLLWREVTGSSHSAGPNSSVASF